MFFMRGYWMTSILDLKLINLMPQYLRNNKDVIAFCEAWDFQKNEIILAADKLQLIKRIMNGDLSNEEVENLLWENHVDYFDDELTHEQKIKLIQIAYNSHLKKGTVFSIEQQLDVILDDLKIIEWFEFGGETNTFYILTKSQITEKKLVKINRIVNSFKRKSSLYRGIHIIEEITIPYKNIIAIEELSEESFEVMLESEFIKDYQKICLTDLSVETL